MNPQPLDLATLPDYSALLLSRARVCYSRRDAKGLLRAARLSIQRFNLWAEDPQEGDEVPFSRVAAATAEVLYLLSALP